MQRYIFILIIFLNFPLIGAAQFCTGTLGENIFLEGDFGSGPANLLSPNPNIAPGYNYTFNVPPVDGQYVLTNNTAVWSGLFDSWLDIGDNSMDPNGYMMVVNASNSPGLFYEQTVTGLCENTLYEFSADMINLIRIGIPNHSDPNVSFLLNGVVLSTTGNIPKTNNWESYGATFTTGIGQQSLTLSLRNNAPGGIGNDLAIDNISFRACGPEISVAPVATEINICQGDAPFQLQATLMGNQYVNPSFQWQESLDGNTWVDIPGANSVTYTHPLLTIVGTYYYRFLVADGVANLSSDKCRINSDAKIINARPTLTIQTDTTLCEGQTLTIGNSTYLETGIYTDVLPSFFGCDSIITTNLTVAISAEFMLDLLVTPPCPNLADASISIENINGGIPPFNFTFQGVDVGTTTFFSDLAGGQTYSFIIKDAGGCSVERSVFIINPAELIADLIVTPPCPNLANGSISIENISGGTTPYNFIFDGIDAGMTTLFSELSGGQTYSFVLQDAIGCSTERSVLVENPLAFMADFIATPPCSGQTDGSIVIENVSGATAPYTYTFEGTAVGTTTLFTDLAGGQTYSIIIEDDVGCTSERSVFIENPAELLLELGSNQVVELGETVKIAPFYNFTPSDFNWQNNQPIDCIDFVDCDELNFLPTTSQQITLNLFIDNGCSVSDSLFIEVLDVRKVYLPNAFSPNADGLNDAFTVFASIGNVEIVEDLKVFNRWGALIFENTNFLPNDLQNGWDGSFKGEQIRLGVYVYTATVRFADGEVLRYSGDVTIVK